MEDLFYIRKVPIYSQRGNWFWSSGGLNLDNNTYIKVSHFVYLLRKIRHNGKGDY